MGGGEGAPIRGAGALILNFGRDEGSLFEGALIREGEGKGRLIRGLQHFSKTNMM